MNGLQLFSNLVDGLHQQPVRRTGGSSIWLHYALVLVQHI